MLEELINFDKWIFEYLHTFARSEGLDFFMIWVSNKYFWIPMYALLVFLLYKNDPKHWYIVVLTVILVFATTDLIAAKLFKPFFERLRPCHNLEFSLWIQLPDGCGGKYGFVSNHAANTFALSSFLWKYFEKVKWIQILLLIYVILTAYSRIYLGAHYPSDILFGWLLAFGVVQMYQFILKKLKYR